MNKHAFIDFYMMYVCCPNRNLLRMM